MPHQPIDHCPTIKVKPWSKDQGEFVEINLSDFDHAKHEAFDGSAPPLAKAPEPEAPAEAAPAAPAKKPAAKRRRKARK